MEQIITFAGILSAITIALTEVIKRTNTIPKNIIPLISIVIGVVIGGITNYIPELVSELSLSGHLLAGLISGLMATGIWETFKNKEGTTKDNKINKKTKTEETNDAKETNDVKEKNEMSDEMYDQYYTTQTKDDGLDDGKPLRTPVEYDETQPFTDDSEDVEFTTMDIADNTPQPKEQPAVEEWEDENELKGSNPDDPKDIPEKPPEQDKEVDESKEVK